MNKKNVIDEVVTKTGLSYDVCESACKAFEKASEKALENKIKGNSQGPEFIVSYISEQTNLSIEQGQMIVDALNQTMDGGLEDKLRFFKGKSTN